MAETSGSTQQQNAETNNGQQPSGDNNNGAPAQAAPELSPASLQELFAITRDQTRVLGTLATSVASLVEEVKKLAISNSRVIEQIQQINGHIQTILAEVRTLATNLEVNSITTPNHNSTLVHGNPENQASGDTLQLNVTANETFDRMNNSLDKLQHTLESNLQKKVTIKRHYKLSNKSNLNTWLDSSNSELASNDLKEIIDQHEKFANDNSEKVVKQKQLIRDIIINHIDDHYHKKILGITEPNIILKKNNRSKTTWV